MKKSEKILEVHKAVGSHVWREYSKEEINEHETLSSEDEALYDKRICEVCHRVESYRNGVWIPQVSGLYTWILEEYLEEDLEKEARVKA